jgi:general L-amino acid transport system permease protein
MLKTRKSRAWAIQGAFIAMVAFLVISSILVARNTLLAQGMNSGFGFLERSTGWDVGFSLIAFSPFDTYGKVIVVGLLNTIFLGLIGIVLANVVGLTIAIFRTSRNGVLNAIGTLYIEVFRNVPIILQALFFYAVFTHLPRTRDAWNLGDLVFVSARGVYFPGLNVIGLSALLFFISLLVGGIVYLWFTSARRFRGLTPGAKRTGKWGIAASSLLVAVSVLAVGRIPETTLMSIPELRGLNFRDGIRIPPELSALAVSMAVYGGAYLAEIIRAGFLSVGKGQAEAAHALGLSPWHVFSRVRLPLAIRAILPTLINQYVWLFKATTLGIAIGFTDFFSVISVSINQSGQTLELIAILMVGFLIMNNTMSFVLNRVNNAIKLKGTQLRT